MTIVAFAAMVVFAAEPSPGQAEPVAPPPLTEREEALAHYADTHFELSLGYLGEWRDDSQGSWELASSKEPAPVGAASLVMPFGGAPFAGFRAAGLTVESRTVWDGVRFTVGFRWPYASFRMADTVQTVVLDGASRELIVRSLSLWEFRTGLGFELPFRRVTPFIDVVGDVQNVSASLVIDGTPTAWKANSFSLGARAGLRIQVSQVFVMIAAEATALGAPRYGGALQAGVAF